jgi:hypothetical protein
MLVINFVPLPQSLGAANWYVREGNLRYEICVGNDFIEHEDLAFSAIPHPHLRASRLSILSVVHGENGSYTRTDWVTRSCDRFSIFRHVYRVRACLLFDLRLIL